jgi:PAS domain S-box-containing protein
MKTEPFSQEDTGVKFRKYPPALALTAPVSPVRLVLLLIVSIFVSNCVIMLILLSLPPSSKLVESLVDGVSTLVITSPILYYLVFTPLLRLIDEWKRAEEALADQSRLLESFFTYTITPLVFLDREFHYIRVNEAYARSCHRNIADFAGHSHFEYFPNPENEAIFRKVVETKEPHHTLATPFLFPSHPEWGTSYWNWTLTPLSDERGEVSFLVFSLEDVTERTRATNALLESEERFRALTENTSDWIWEVDADQRYTYVSPRVTDLFGYEVDQVLGKSPFDLMPPEEARRVRDLRAPLIESRSPLKGMVSTAQCADGQLVVLETNAVPVFTRNGQFCGYYGIDRDVTRRMLAQETLRRSEERYRSLVVATAQIVWTTNANGEVGADIPLYRTFTGQTEEEVQGRGWLNALHPDDRQRTEAVWSHAVTTRTSYATEYRLKRYDGEYRTFAARAVPVLETDGTIREWVGTCTDITERKHAEKMLHSYTERLQMLSQRLLETQEAERRSLARELHDEIGQNLTALKISIQTARLSTKTPSLKSHLTEGARAVDRLLNQVRNISHSLHPSVLDDLGLFPALRWVTERMTEQFRIKIDLEGEDVDERFPPSIEIACFRVAQESLTNILRYSEANHVRITLRKQNDRLLVTIRDDGIGFDVVNAREHARHGSSMGIIGMEERCRLIGGQLDIQSVPGKGTIVQAWFPITPPVEPSEQ